MSAKDLEEVVDATGKARRSDDGSSTGLTVDAADSLPFLVTHWLSNYGNDQQNTNQEAVERIKKAASELASAFASVGGFGEATRPSLSDHSTLSHSAATRHATYADVKRQWSNCPPDQLMHLLHGSMAANQTADTTAQAAARPNMVMASSEAVNHRARNPESGRTLAEAINLEETSTEAPTASSTLQPPVLLQATDTKQKSNDADDDKNIVPHTAPARPLGSTFSKVSGQAAELVRSFLALRDKHRHDEQQIRTIKHSLQLQEKNRRDIILQRSALLGKNGTMDAQTKLAALDELRDAEQNCHRVTAQLQRQLTTLQRTFNIDLHELVKAEEKARSAFMAARNVQQSYRDPFDATNGDSLVGRNRIVLNLSARQVGVDRYGGRGVPRSMGRIRADGARTETHKALLHSRLSHAATINTHLSYPIYCLRFDRTGRYFITGADDYLVKVFCLGGDVRANRGLDVASYKRGAVLVCTLRGHAGVINDIDVSSDNCFLATASEDGDCRVWGLKDGCPIAILRGHVGGANMVTWSTLTPYRLVTTGADGLARTWDIREACLKRYEKWIGKRPEYRRPKARSEERHDSLASGREANAPVALPPLPVRQETESAGVPGQLEPPAIPLPPLPRAVADASAQNQAVAQGGGDGVDAGRFVANDTIDEGVKLIAKLQHGASLDERMGGLGTRSRRAAVKVICVARCPYGGHFATGSDDGICRVWQDEDDLAVEEIDAKHSRWSRVGVSLRRRGSGGGSGSGRLLLSLKGHLSAITDLQYSHAGDRILTASQKDGVVRIWSWSGDPASAGVTTQWTPQRDTTGCQTSHILIKLTNPNTPSGSSAQSSRRRPNRNSSSTVTCDVAAWVHDDSKIVTSQCQLVKQSTTEINPGSQYLFLWDSITGHCLLGISGAHTMQCPVVIPHPTDASIICSAGADGVVKLWDWETGNCAFSHKNTVEFGPVEARERGKISGYLDGAFSPDGTIVLTDDSGRVTVLDCLCPSSNGSTGLPDEPPSWMKEQYFANDYYELYYDANGYCVERGSEQPPHLAPRGVRCSHSGAPWADAVSDAFRSLSGPLPIPEREARFFRRSVRSQAEKAMQRHVVLRGNLVSQFDPQTTMLIDSGGKVTESRVSSVLGELEDEPTTEVEETRTRTPAGRSQRLSSNWRWRDYTDILREEANEVDEPDSDDEEFQLNEGRSGRASSNVDDEEHDSDEEMFELEEEPSRASTRRARRRYIDDDSSDDDVIEFMSTNNVPTGPFVADYDAHFFRMPGSADPNRQWLCRMESNSAYAGRKSYAPQVGDTVVYIPRAHYETIADFPILTAPWQSWPEEAVWPVVRCRIGNIRYRFPYKAYFGRNSSGQVCRSIVTILTLEVTGIPELSQDRMFGWPKPTFIAPTRSHTFELSMFESEHTDFVIPMGLYSSRLSRLEEALSASDGPEIEAYYGDDTGHEDPDLVPYSGRVIEHTEESDNLNDPNLCGSGYGSVVVTWSDGEADTVSPWEINARVSNHEAAPSRPRLSEDEKRTVRDALTSIKGIPSVEDLFLLPVNQRRYSDYGSRVEVPMDLTFLANRLEADYYADRMSAVADVKLIRDNCIKYNGPADDLSAVAGQMFDKFEELVLTEDERRSCREFEAALIASAPRRTEAEQIDEDVADNGAPIAQRRSRRQVRARSSLEALPTPRLARNESRRRSQGRTLETQPRQRNVPRRGGTSSSARPTRSNRSLLESRNRPVQAVPLDGPNRRGRSTRSSQRNIQESRRPLRSSTRQSSQRDSLLGLSSRQRGTSRQAQAEARTSRLLSRSQRTSSQRSPDSPTRRSSRRAVLANSYADEPSDIDDVFESEAEVETGHSSDEDLNLNLSSDSEVRRSSRQRNSGGSRPSRRSTRTRAHTRAASPEEDSSASEKIPATRQRARRRSSVAESTDDEVSVESDSFEGEKRTSRRSGASTRGRHSKEDPPSEEETDASSEPEERPSRHDRSSRASRRAIEPSEEEHSEDSSGNDINERATSRNRKRARRLSESSSRRSSRKRSSQTYVVPSSSEFGSDVEESEEEVQQTASKSKSSGRAKQASGKRPKGQSGAPAKRRKTSPDRNKPVFEPKEWPWIHMKDITKVCNSILERLRNLDEGQVFALPVEEAYPDVAADYRRAITRPMDFRTIEEERLPRYKSIREFQQDLMLTFNNCIEFNGADSELGQLSIMMLQVVEDTFTEVCKELDVLLPRRW